MHIPCTVYGAPFEMSVPDSFYEVHVILSVILGPANPATGQLCNC